MFWWRKTFANRTDIPAGAADSPGRRWYAKSTIERPRSDSGIKILSSLSQRSIPTLAPSTLEKDSGAVEISIAVWCSFMGVNILFAIFNVREI
jgi:hypothetical protein